MTPLASTPAAYASLVALLKGVPECAGYEDVVASLAMTVRPESPNLFAIALVAIGDVETHFGKARGYVDGRGDWTLRTGHWLQSAHVTVVEDAPPGWSLPRRKDGTAIPGPYAMPEDGKGWGVDLWQLDWERARELNLDPDAVRLACARELDACCLAFPGKLEAAFCAYNAGPAAVHHALSEGRDPNEVTTDNYGARAIGVYRKRSLFVIPAVGGASGDV